MFGIAQYLGHVDDDLVVWIVKIGFALRIRSPDLRAQRQRDDQRDVAHSRACAKPPLRGGAQ
jgi:hypothetical protein